LPSVASLFVTLEVMQKAEDLKDAMEAVTTDNPMALTALQKWTKFWLKFSIYLGCVRGATKIPLTSLIHDHEEVTDDIAAVDYDTDDEHLITTTIHEDPHYEFDNTMLHTSSNR
jgi:hypothetical protein